MRRLATLLVVSALFVPLGATQALAGGAAQRVGVQDLDDTVSIYCAGSGRTYTFVSGSVEVIGRDPSKAAHLTIVNGRALDLDGNEYRAVLTETYNDPGGRLTVSVVFIGEHGIADRTNAVARDRVGLLFVNGDCDFVDASTS